MSDSWILTEMPCMAHTPGPWRVHSEVPNRIILNGSACYEVVDPISESSLCNHADMRLMAAGPDLLAVCKNIAGDMQAILDGDDFSGMSDAELFGVMLRSLNAAIFKADGRD